MNNIRSMVSIFYLISFCLIVAGCATAPLPKRLENPTATETKVFYTDCQGPIASCAAMVLPTYVVAGILPDKAPIHGPALVYFKPGPRELTVAWWNLRFKGGGYTMPGGLKGDFKAGGVYKIQAREAGGAVDFKMGLMDPGRLQDWSGRIIAHRLKNNVIDQEPVAPASGLIPVTATHRTWIQATRVSPDGQRILYWGMSEGMPSLVSRTTEFIAFLKNNFLYSAFSLVLL